MGEGCPQVAAYAAEPLAATLGVSPVTAKQLAGLDTTEMFAGLPDGACKEPQFGFVLRGTATVSYTDGESETLSPGEAYYLRPGHNVHVDRDAEFVEFTRADQTPGINTLEL